MSGKETGQLREMHQGRVGLSPRRPRKLRLRARSAPHTNVPTSGGKRNPTLSRVSRTSQGPRILFLDIETAPLQSYHWGLWDENIGIEQIVSEWSILSVAWKWLGERKVHSRDTGHQKDVRDDREVLRVTRDLLDEADIVVAQNGKKFDVPKINARLLLSGFAPYSPIKIVDTLLVAKKHFAFTSNKLAWLSKHLSRAPKLEHREFPGIELWKQCLAKNARAWRVMRRYNRRDISTLEEVYLQLRPWIESHPNVAVYDPSDTPRCPKCGSEDLIRNGSSCTQVGQYARYFCRACKGFSRGRLLLNSRSKRASLLSN